MEDLAELALAPNRQTLVNKMEVGDTVSISRRVEMQYGFAPGAIAKHHQQLRGTLGQQTDRARKAFKDREFKVECGSFMTSEGAMIITAAVSRLR